MRCIRQQQAHQFLLSYPSCIWNGSSFIKFKKTTYKINFAHGNYPQYVFLGSIPCQFLGFLFFETNMNIVKSHLSPKKCLSTFPHHHDCCISKLIVACLNAYLPSFWRSLLPSLTEDTVSPWTESFSLSRNECVGTLTLKFFSLDSSHVSLHQVCHFSCCGMLPDNVIVKSSCSSLIHVLIVWGET